MNLNELVQKHSTSIANLFPEFEESAKVFAGWGVPWIEVKFEFEDKTTYSFSLNQLTKRFMLNTHGANIDDGLIGLVVGRILEYIDTHELDGLKIQPVEKLEKPETEKSESPVESTS